MTDLSAFPITARWPAEHPDRLQLYSLNTPNGVKVSIMLEETGLPYEPHMIDIGSNETWTPEFIATLGWVRNLVTFYEAGELVEFDSLANVPAWLERGLEIPRRD